MLEQQQQSHSGYNWPQLLDKSFMWPFSLKKSHNKHVSQHQLQFWGPVYEGVVAGDLRVSVLMLGCSRWEMLESRKVETVLVAPTF